MPEAVSSALSERRVLLVLTTAYGNCGALPFVLILPIVKNWYITRDDPESLETGLGEAYTKEVAEAYTAMWGVVETTMLSGADAPKK